MDSLKHLKDFQVIELRRYQLKEGGQADFARYFESYVPEAFQQLGSIIFGQFLERHNPANFTWFRGYHNMEELGYVNKAFYDGAVWAEHSATLNEFIIDHTNVLLLAPLHPERGLAVLPTVDPVKESEGAQGVVVAQIFAVKPNEVTAFAEQAEAIFASYRNSGGREAGVLVTLDEPNNFPRHPIRTDGPFLVWLGILKDSQMFQSNFKELVENSLPTLLATDLLRATPELVVLNPTSRSRLRWLHLL